MVVLVTSPTLKKEVLYRWPWLFQGPHRHCSWKPHCMTESSQLQPGLQRTATTELLKNVSAPITRNTLSPWRVSSSLIRCWVFQSHRADQFLVATSLRFFDPSSAVCLKSSGIVSPSLLSLKVGHCFFSFQVSKSQPRGNHPRTCSSMLYSGLWLNALISTNLSFPAYFTVCLGPAPSGSTPTHTSIPASTH